MGLLFFFKTREDNQLLEKFNTEDILIRKGTYKICRCCKSGAIPDVFFDHYLWLRL